MGNTIGISDYKDSSIEKSMNESFGLEKGGKTTMVIHADRVRKALDNKLEKGLIDEVTYLKALVQLDNVLEKAGKGEGSRGGKVIGHTKSGKAVYDHKRGADYSDFSHQDHKDASDIHTKEALKHNAKREKLTGDESVNVHQDVSNKVRHHANAASSHTEITMGYVDGKRTLGQTRSGKHVFEYANDHRHDDFNGQDHTDAANLHSHHVVKHMSSGDNAKSNHHYEQRAEHWKKSFDHNSNESYAHSKKEYEKQQEMLRTP